MMSKYNSRVTYTLLFVVLRLCHTHKIGSIPVHRRHPRDFFFFWGITLHRAQHYYRVFPKTAVAPRYKLPPYIAVRRAARVGEWAGDGEGRDNNSAHLDRIIRTPSHPCRHPSPAVLGV